MSPKTVLRTKEPAVGGPEAARAASAGRADRTVRRARRRFVRRQWARRWLAWRRVLAGLVALGLVGGLVWTVFFSSALAVRGVQVEGTDVLSPQQVRSAAAVPQGVPLATVDLAAVRARVERLRPVRSVDVSRAWPHGIRVALTERTAVAALRRGGTWQGIDATGLRFRSWATRPAGLPVVRVAPNAPRGTLTEVSRVVAALPAALQGRVAHLSARTVDTITLRLRNGREVLWGSGDGSARKAQVLAVLLREKASLYDVSIPGQPVIRR